MLQNWRIAYPTFKRNTIFIKIGSLNKLDVMCFSKSTHWVQFSYLCSSVWSTSENCKIDVNWMHAQQLRNCQKGRKGEAQEDRKPPYTWCKEHTHLSRTKMNTLHRVLNGTNCALLKTFMWWSTFWTLLHWNALVSVTSVSDWVFIGTLGLEIVPSTTVCAQLLLH